MSINKPGVNSSGAVAQASNTTKQEAPVRQSIGAIGLGNLFQSRTISPYGAGVVLTQWEKAIKNCFDKYGIAYSGDAASTVIIKLDREVDQLPFSVICIVEPYEIKTTPDSEGKVYASVYSLILEGSSEALADRHETIGGKPVFIKTVASDIYGTELIGRITTRVAADLNMVLERVVNVGSMVIPSETDAADERAVEMILFHAEDAAAQTTAALNGNSQRFSIRDLAANLRLKAVVNYNGGDFQTVTGLPVRSNISITTVGVENNANSTLMSNTATPLVRVDGYMDLTIVPPTPVAYGQVQRTQLYRAIYVITGLRSLVNGNSLELQLLALASLATINNNRAWAGQFKPSTRQRHGTEDFGDIGGIGFQWSPTPGQPYGARIDTGATFSNEAFATLAGQAIEEFPIYAMDVARGGELSWLNETFVGASNKTYRGYADAANAIVNAAKALTNNAFKWDITNQFVFATGSHVHIGYYTDNNGVKHDLREFDTLAMLNLYGATAMQVVADWNSTFDNINEPIEIRLEKRFAIIENLAGGKVRVKDRAERLTIAPEFITELVRAGLESGLHLQPDGVEAIYGAVTPYNTVYAQMQGGQFDPRVMQQQGFNNGYKQSINTFSRFS